MKLLNTTIFLSICIFIILFCGCYEKSQDISQDMSYNGKSQDNGRYQSMFLDSDSPKNYPNMNKFPKRYYKISDEMYPDVKKRDLYTLNYILKTIKLPPYKKNYYDCSEASCQVEWILEGYGFKTYIATNDNHAWVLVQLDDGKMVAVECTLLCEDNYCPDQAIKYEEYPYYHPERYVDTPDMLLIPYNNKRMLITQLDWWSYPKNIEIKKKLYKLN